MLIDKGYPSPGLAVVPTVLGTVLLLASMSQQSIIGRILAGKLAVGIGLVSYSAYLWHQPIFAFARLSQNQNSTITLIGLIIVTLFLAYLSWRYIEKPFRNYTIISTKTVLISCLVTTLVLCSLGTVGHLKRGHLQSFDDKTLALADTAQMSPFRGVCHTDSLEYLKPSKACVYGTKTPSWAVFGDSHGVELALALSETLALQHDGVVHLTFSGCPPALDFTYSNKGCHEWTNEALSFLEGAEEISNILIVYRTAFHLYGEHRIHGDNYKKLRLGHPPLFLKDLSTDAAREAYWNNLQSIISRLKKAGKSVYVLSPVPELPWPIDNLIFDLDLPIDNRKNAPGSSQKFLEARYTEINARLRALDNNDVRVLWLDKVLCDMVSCIATKNGTAYYFDDNYLSMAGARAVIKDLIEKGKLSLEVLP